MPVQTLSTGESVIFVKVMVIETKYHPGEGGGCQGIFIYNLKSRAKDPFCLVSSPSEKRCPVLPVMTRIIFVRAEQYLLCVNSAKGSSDVKTATASAPHAL